jgi:hypothetical protein
VKGWKIVMLRDGRVVQMCNTCGAIEQTEAGAKVCSSPWHKAQERRADDRRAEP